MFIYFFNLLFDTINQIIYSLYSKCQIYSQVPVINTDFVLNSGTNLEPFLSQVISRIIKSTADPSGTQSPSTTATSTSVSDIYGTVETTHIQHCQFTYITLKNTNVSFSSAAGSSTSIINSRGPDLSDVSTSFNIFITVIFVLISFFYKFFDISLLNLLPSLARARIFFSICSNTILAYNILLIKLFFKSPFPALFVTESQVSAKSKIPLNVNISLLNPPLKYTNNINFTSTIYFSPLNNPEHK